MRLFSKLIAAQLLAATMLLAGGASGNATTVPFTPDGIGDTTYTDVITIPVGPAGGTLSFNLTLGADYSLGVNSGASGFFNLEVDASPIFSFAFLSAAPSTTGTTDYGDQTSGILSPANITDTSLWHVIVAAGTSQVVLSPDGFFSGYCPDADNCHTPNATFSYDFVANPAAAPLPAALPLFAGGVGALGVIGWRRKRKAVS